MYEEAGYGGEEVVGDVSEKAVMVEVERESERLDEIIGE